MNKILVVDDELSIRESFSLILDGRYKLITAASGEGALKAAADQKIDLAYLDIRMPGLDGLETLKRLKQIDPAIEVVMVTAVNEVNKASAAIKLGARDYIIKPFDVDAILKMTAAILRRQELLREGAAIQQKGKKLIGQSERIVGSEPDHRSGRAAKHARPDQRRTGDGKGARRRTDPRTKSAP